MPAGQVDQHRAVVVPPAQRELIDTEHRHPADRRIRQTTGQPEQRRPAQFHAQLGGQPRSGRPAKANPTATSAPCRPALRRAWFRSTPRSARRKCLQNSRRGRRRTSSLPARPPPGDPTRADPPGAADNENAPGSTPPTPAARVSRARERAATTTASTRSMPWIRTGGCCNPSRRRRGRADHHRQIPLADCLGPHPRADLPGDRRDRPAPPAQGHRRQVDGHPV